MCISLSALHQFTAPALLAAKHVVTEKRVNEWSGKTGGATENITGNCRQYIYPEP